MICDSNLKPRTRRSEPPYRMLRHRHHRLISPVCADASQRLVSLGMARDKEAYHIFMQVRDRLALEGSRVSARAWLNVLAVPA